MLQHQLDQQFQSQPLIIKTQQEAISQLHVQAILHRGLYVLDFSYHTFLMAISFKLLKKKGLGNP